MKIQQFYVAIFLTFLVSLGECSKNVSIVIVGAGAAGVAAATKLMENGFDNIVILEAESRIGGRIHSVKCGDSYIDLGAQFCAGENGNVVYQLAKDYDILEHTNIDVDFFHSSLGKIDRKLGKIAVDFMDSCYIYDENKINEYKHKTLDEHCTQIMNNTIENLHESDENNIKVLKSIPDLIHSIILTENGAMNWNDLALVNDYEDCEGDEYIIWKKVGYKTILDIMMKKYPDESKQLPFNEKLQLNKEVTKILWKDDAHHHHMKVHVECKDGTRHSADHVIFTPSLGVLKHEHEHMFVPQLPQEKVDAINKMGYGVAMIIAYHFPERSWPEAKNKSWGLLWSKEDVEKLATEFPEGPTKNGVHWLQRMVQILPDIEGHPNLMYAYIGGEMVPEIEQLSDETLINGLHYVLNKFCSISTKPDKVYRYNWYADPHFRGTFSYQTLESHQGNESAEVTLSKPYICENGSPMLMFAGEATHPKYYATVHGAIETGYREADRIIQLYAQK